MNTMNTLKKVLVALGLAEAEGESKVQKFASTYTTTDGKVIAADAFEVGNPIFVLAEDGTPAPATEGTYETTEWKITVDASGIISAVDPVAPPAKEEAAPAESEMEKKVISALEALVAELKNVKMKMTEIEGNLKTANEKIEKFSKAPGTEKIKTSKFQREEAENPIEKRLEMLRKLKEEAKS